MSAVEHDRFTDLSVRIGNRVFLDVQAMAEVIGCSVRTARRLIAEGKIKTVSFDPHKRPGGFNLKILARDILEYLRRPDSFGRRDAPEEIQTKRIETRKRNR